jgi:hypothetical protein
MTSTTNGTNENPQPSPKSTILYQIHRSKGWTEDKMRRYIVKWQKPSQFYSMRKGIYAFLPEWVELLINNDVCPLFSNRELDQIAEFVYQNDIIPILDYAPSELKEHTKAVWWIIPLSIWKEDVASFVFLDKNGFYSLYWSDDERTEIDIQLIFNWDSVSEVEYELALENDSNVNRLTLYQPSGDYLSFDEFVNNDHKSDQGSYLKVVLAIWLARKKTIEASKDKPYWLEGFGGEGFISFKSPYDLLDEKYWQNPYRPDVTEHQL